MTTLGQHNHFACGGMVREHLLLVNVFFGEVGISFFKMKISSTFKSCEIFKFFCKVAK
jgi:hypothetical protein